ncbi:hypothetical protein AXG93_138s1270 [Marchantia polymorpha subsp. ruderalis]|uniref:Uncharacterized protein n=1 Tax=Marchantia polymorpha subsp. ruderalis TaxID=1480154 RepID=A0A176VPS7_MARPO|nr:hypothetical protein AXG93_138s1270 [Marchantia polymorpha subsp. ruderalis]
MKAAVTSLHLMAKRATSLVDDSFSRERRKSGHALPATFLGSPYSIEVSDPPAQAPREGRWGSFGTIVVDCPDPQGLYWIVHSAKPTAFEEKLVRASCVHNHVLTEQRTAKSETNCGTWTSFKQFARSVPMRQGFM